MHTRSVSHFLTDQFPELNHPAYQTAMEKIGFVAVASTLILTLAATVVLILIDL
jgi:hypothetical protein